MFGAGVTTQRTRESVSNAQLVMWGMPLFRKIIDRVGIEKFLTPIDPRLHDTEDTPIHERWLHEAQAWWTMSRPTTTAGTAPISEEAVAQQLSKMIAMSPAPGSTSLTVTHVAASPELAQKVVQATLESAVEVYLERLRLDKPAQLREEVENARAAATVAEQDLADFETKLGVLDFSAERSRLRSDLIEREFDLDSGQIQFASRIAEQDQLKEMLSELSAVDEVGASTTRLPNPRYELLEDLIRELEIRLMDLDLSDEIGPVAKEERRGKINRNLGELRQELLQTPQTVEASAEAASVANPRFAALQTLLDAARVAAQSLERSNAELAKVIERDRQKLAKLESAAPRHRELQAKVELALDRVRSLSESERSFEPYELVRRMELSNLKIIDATFQPEKVGPQRAKLLAFGLLLGCAAGLGLAVLRFVTKKQIRDEVDAILLGAPFHGRLQRERREPGALPPGAEVLAGIEPQVADLWTRIPLDRNAGRGVSIGFLRDVPGERPSMAAACFAMGLALHGGERVVLVCADAAGSWLLRRANLQPPAGWSQVAAGLVELEDALVPMGPGQLSMLSAGHVPEAGLASSASRQLLDRLTREGYHVVIELPALTADPTARAALALLDGCEIVLTRGRSTRATGRDAVQVARQSGATLAGVLIEDNLPRRGALHHEPGDASGGIRMTAEGPARPETPGLAGLRRGG
jgi:uncharacterized protein involved in exopolysaccharide biosynthesis